MLYLIDQFWPSVFVYSVSASIFLVCAKVGSYVLFLASMYYCLSLCDVRKPIALLLSAIQPISYIIVDVVHVYRAFQEIERNSWNPGVCGEWWGYVHDIVIGCSFF